MVNIKENIYKMFKIRNNLGRDMNGMYFIQINGNEEEIDKFRRINTNGSVEFDDEEIYTESEVYALKKIKFMFKYSGHNDNEERLILKGKMTIPGKNKKYKIKKLENWWTKHLRDPKQPMWNKIIEEIIDLTS